MKLIIHKYFLDNDLYILTCMFLDNDCIPTKAGFIIRKNNSLGMDRLYHLKYLVGKTWDFSLFISGNAQSLTGCLNLLNLWC